MDIYLFGEDRRGRALFPFTCEVSFRGGRKNGDGE